MKQGGKKFLSNVISVCTVQRNWCLSGVLRDSALTQRFLNKFKGFLPMSALSAAQEGMPGSQIKNSAKRREAAAC